MNRSRVLVVHPDPSALSLLLSMLGTSGRPLAAAGSGVEAVREAERGEVGLVVAGVDPAEEGCLGLLAYFRRRRPATPVVLLFSAADPARAREAARLGAEAVLKYPVPATDLRAAVLQGLAAAGEGGGGPGRPPDEARRGPAASSSAPGPEVVGDDPAVRQAVEMAGAVAPTRVSVLIVGERGTGKTLLAGAVHRRAGGEGGPFETIDCGAGAADFAALLAAKAARAAGGTLCLDRVGALGPESQAALSHFLGGGRGGAGAPRLVLTNDEGLARPVALGGFRQDLFYRVGGVTLNLPPLRRRGADVLLLAEHFRERQAGASGKGSAGFSREAQALLTQYSWPGNVAELEAMVRLGVGRCSGRVVFAKDLWPGRRRPAAPGGRFGPASAPPSGLRPLDVALAESEKRILTESLQALRWNRRETARRLDINRTTLYKKMKKHGLLKADDVFDVFEAEGLGAASRGG